MKILLYIIILIFLTAPAMLIAYLLPESETIYMLASLAFVLLVVVFVFNVILKIVNRKKNKRVDLQKEKEDMFQRVSQAENQLPEYTKKINRLIRIGDLYVFLLFMLGYFSLIGFFSMTFHNPNTSSVHLMTLILLFYLTGLAMSFIHFEKNPMDAKYLLLENEYPMLNGMVQNILKEIGYQTQITLYLTFDFNASVTRVKNKYVVTIGMIMLMLLNEHEIKTVLMHEIAHIYHGDILSSSKRNKKITRWIQRMEGDERFDVFGSGFIIKIFTEVIGQKIYKEHSFYQLAISKQIEKRVDDYVKQHGNVQDYVNGLVKTRIFDLYNGELSSMLNYEEETVSKTFYNDLMTSFRKGYEKKKAIYQEIVEHELPLNFGTHPNVNERMRAVGHADYQLDFSFENRHAEIEKLIIFANQDYAEHMEEQYLANRKNYYLIPKETISVYQSRTLEDLSLEELIEYMEALTQLADVEGVRKLCIKILNLYPHNANAKFNLALIQLIEDRNQSGVELMYEAIKGNSNYIDPGMQSIGRFCQEMGLKDLLEEYRSKMPQYGDFLFNEFNEVTQLNYRDKLVKIDLAAEEMEAVIAYVSTLETIKKLYAIKKIISPAFSATLIGIVRKDDSEEEAFDQDMEHIFTFLDIREPQYGLLDATSPFMERLFLKVKDSKYYEA